jgi:hypothetical protein
MTVQGLPLPLALTFLQEMHPGEIQQTAFETPGHP